MSQSLLIVTTREGRTYAGSRSECPTRTSRIDTAGMSLSGRIKLRWSINL